MLAIRQIMTSYEGMPVLRGIALDVQPGEIVCLLGPSGCGKTTLLRVIAGLEPADSGDVLYDGHSVVAIPVHQRDFGLMFQDYALFPHLKVAENITFGLKMHGISPAQQRLRLREVLKLVGLVGFERRDVAQLSGGERQRVALARSLAPNPRLLMLDEPLSSLDASLKERLVIELREIIKQVGLTALYVTHDQREAFAVADRVAIMNDGRIEQVGTPEAIYRQPASEFVARFLGLSNIAVVLRQEGQYAHTPLGDFTVAGQPRAVLVHPDDIRVVTKDSPDAIHGQVRERVFLGDAYRLVLEVNDNLNLTLKIPSRDAAIPAMGDSIAVQVMPETIVELS
jgi:ABC-type Fe3+/spermidine/putrescine transport system ATPase subunit